MAHRYVGLVIAIFLVIAGLTGMVLAFYWELDDWVNSDIMQVSPPTPNTPLLSPLELREKVQQQFPHIWVNKVNLEVVEKHASTFTLRSPNDPQHQHTTSFTYDEAFVNPYTGKVIAARKWGDISQGMINLVPFIYTLHFELELGEIGMTVFGVIALLWTLDCFVGAYLTLPATQKKANQHPVKWLKRWKKSWKIRWNSSACKVNFDLHRAGGLWIWAMLFVIAWSSVGFNLPQVYNPAMKAVFDFQTADRDIPLLKQPLSKPSISFEEALLKAEQLMQKQAIASSFTIINSERISYDPHRGVYQYQAKTSLDINQKVGQTTIYLDADSGQQIAVFLPSHQASGDTVNAWLMYLHTAKMWGLPYQIFVCAMGLLVAMLSVTGIYIWWEKSRGKAKARLQLSQIKLTN